MPEGKTTAASSENLAEFMDRLEIACVAKPLVDAIIERIGQDEAEAKARAARLFFGKDHGERMNPVDFSEELGRVTSRCFGLCVAIQGMLADEDAKFAIGLYQLAIDIADQMNQLHEAYSAEQAVDVLASQVADADRDIGSGFALGQREDPRPVSQEAALAALNEAEAAQ